jgi:CHAT domain-containing protein
LLAGVAATLAGCGAAPPPARLDSFSLGRNAAGEPCVASRNWQDPATPDPFARAYAITCSNATAARSLGTVRAVEQTAEALAAVDAQFDCGERRDITIDGRPATAGRCVDRVTGLPSIRIDLVHGGKHYVASGTSALLPQIEEAVTVTAGLRRPSIDTTRALRSSVDLAALGEAAPTSVSSTDASAGTAAGALAQGTGFNHKGLHVEASRVLNDALSRLDPATPPAIRAELLLEAGLADSNIRFPDTAQAHFAAADAIFAAEPSVRTLFLSRKRDTYRALDALNRGAFAETLAVLDRAADTPPATQPLNDPATLAAINQPVAGSAPNAVAVADAGQLSRAVLDAQMHYARSVALLGQGDAARAATEIDAAAAVYRPLSNERLDQGQLFWLGARIARQQGRLEARRGAYGDALDSFDRAVDLLRRGSIANGGTGGEPAVADAALERAAIYARTGVSRKNARDAFGAAVDTLIASGATSAGGSIAMEDYLDLLVAEAGSAPRADTYERFFRAVQATGEPAVARQVSELRNVVTADPSVGAAVRERADLERELTRLRYAISGQAEGEAKTSTADYERARQAAEARLLEIDAQLAADPRYRSLDESPATLAELRQRLRPGETFLKLTTLNRRIYGMVVTAEHTYLYHVAQSDAAKDAVMALSEQLRGSIDGQLANGKLVPFDEARAYTLYRLVAGPAADLLVTTKALVVDPSGPLQRLPVGVLVTRYSPDRPRVDPFDFSNAAFLAANTAISTALSPRSFLVSRALPASRAQRSFLGFGEHEVPSLAAFGSGPVQIGFGCTVPGDRLGAVARTPKPIDAKELRIASTALGVTDAEVVTGRAFSDAGVEARGDLNQFEVVHFATHGLEEGMWGCAKSPPALVTSFAAAGSDGLLDFAEIARLRLDANLVVLSACDTAAGVRGEALARSSGQEQAGSALEGLVRAFLTANARSVLATYWQVSAEEESDAFMRTFYSAARSGTIGEALRDAQKSLIAQPQYSHPFYWAPYFLVGDSAKPMLTARAEQVARR